MLAWTRQAALVAGVLLQVSCASRELSVELANGTADEIAVREQLERLQDRHDLAAYLFTQRVRIDRGELPHSHPVLTLHTRHADDDDLQLSTLLHEQIHWYLDRRQLRVDAVIAELRRRYPQVPVGFPEGARDRYSTYLHLLVNRLEYRALSDLIGKARADAAFAFWSDDHYTWIYRKVLEDGAAIEALLARHELTGRMERPAE